MHYPFWDVAIGYGPLMAAIAILHVFISHFAIGGGLYLVVVETFARKAGATARLAFLERLSRFFVLVTLVLGALTGVGIWFIIGLLNPAATELLIHNFVWGWATEWCFFVIEIAAAILYYYGWRRMSARNHLILGWIYFGAAWMSLFIINGILSFMLTPDGWLQTGEFWDGFFNATFWSSLVLRTGVSVMLAGLYALLVASQLPDKTKLVRYNAVWAIVGVIITVPSFLWFRSDIPVQITATVTEMMPEVMMWMDRTLWLAAILGAVVILFGLLLSRFYHISIAIVVMVLGIAWFGSFEWYRETVRKPYVVYNYMYGNAVEVANVAQYQEDGMLAHMTYRTGDDGRDLWNRACGSCHTISGYRAVRNVYDGTDEEFIAGTIRGTHRMRGNMPPFAGSDDEVAMLAAHIAAQIDTRPMADVYGLSGVELGKKAYDIRCGICHEIGGYNDKSPALIGLEASDYEDLLDIAGDIATEMPPYTGDSTERAALIEFLLTLEEGGGQ